MQQISIATRVASGLALSFLWHRVNSVPRDRPFAITVTPSSQHRGSCLAASTTGDDLAQQAVAVGFADIPTLAVSVLSGGTADRELLTAALNTVHRKVRLGFREPGGSQEVAQ